jgi:pimeloyl-ACP methyl ester carboxylesterase
LAKPAAVEIEVRGTTVRVMRAGTGEPLLVLRGTDASDDWCPWLDMLAAHFDVIVPEHPGFGGKPMPQWLDRLSDMANFHLDLIDRLGLSRVHVAGTSLGGWIAAELAHRCSAGLTSLTLVAAAGIRVPGSEIFDVFLASEEQGLRARFLDNAKAGEAVARMLRPETEDVRLANAITIARVAWQPRLYDPHLAKWLHRIKAPTLVVWGADDRILPIAHAEVFANSIPGARKLIVGDCGHWVQHEQPDALAAAILHHAREHGSAV